MLPELIDKTCAKGWAVWHALRLGWACLRRGCLSPLPASNTLPRVHTVNWLRSHCDPIIQCMFMEQPLYTTHGGGAKGHPGDRAPPALLGHTCCWWGNHPDLLCPRTPGPPLCSFIQFILAPILPDGCLHMLAMLATPPFLDGLLFWGREDGMVPVNSGESGRIQSVRNSVGHKGDVSKDQWESRSEACYGLVCLYLETL